VSGLNNDFDMLALGPSCLLEVNTCTNAPDSAVR